MITNVGVIIFWGITHTLYNSLCNFKSKTTMKYLIILSFLVMGCGILDSTLPEEPEPQEPPKPKCELLITYFPPSPDGTNTICLN